jgi:hypothetical protein
MPKFGEFSSARLKPTWDDNTSAPAKDSTGWKRGAVGIDGAFDADGRDFCRTASRKADSFIYGPTTSQKRRDGAMKVLTDASDPGTIINGGDKGCRGVDE